MTTLKHKARGAVKVRNPLLPSKPRRKKKRARSPRRTQGD